MSHFERLRTLLCCTVSTLHVRIPTMGESSALLGEAGTIKGNPGKKSLLVQKIPVIGWLPQYNLQKFQVSLINPRVIPALFTTWGAAVWCLCIELQWRCG